MLEKFIALSEKYENFDIMTNTMLNELVEKIFVHERDRKGSKGSQDTTQTVEIYFNFVGRYIPPHFGEVVLTDEEKEELRKKEERKDRLHQNYLRRKANGKQREYEERTKSEKRKKMEEKKAALRAEDMAKGVYILTGSLPIFDHFADFLLRTNIFSLLLLQFAYLSAILTISTILVKMR